MTFDVGSSVNGVIQLHHKSLHQNVSTMREQRILYSIKPNTLVWHLRNLKTMAVTTAHSLSFVRTPISKAKICNQSQADCKYYSTEKRRSTEVTPTAVICNRKNTAMHAAPPSS